MCFNDCPVMEMRKTPFRHFTLDIHSESSLGLAPSYGDLKRNNWSSYPDLS